MSTSTSMQDHLDALDRIFGEDPDGRSHSDLNPFGGGREAALNYIAPIMPYLRGRNRLSRGKLAGSSVLDLGCGEGFLMQELAVAGVRSTGIDSDPAAKELAQVNGLHVMERDVLDYLRDPVMEVVSFDAIVISHIIEHFDSDGQKELLRLASTRLRRNGRLVIVTPNFENPVVSGKVFWLDPTHVRPMPSDLLRHELTELGLQVLDEGATWPWTRRRLLRDMRAAGHDIPERSLATWARLSLRYAKLFAHNGPQLNLLRGDLWMVAEKR